MPAGTDSGVERFDGVGDGWRGRLAAKVGGVRYFMRRRDWNRYLVGSDLCMMERLRFGRLPTLDDEK